MISTTLPKYSSPFFFFPKAYCLVASMNRTGILYTRLLKNATSVYGCLESWPELFRIRNDPSLLDRCKASSADLRSQAPAYQGLPCSSASWSAKVELNGKLGTGPSAAGLPPSVNPGRDLRTPLTFSSFCALTETLPHCCMSSMGHTQN